MSAVMSSCGEAREELVCSCSEGTARSAGQAATRRTDAMGAAEQSGA
jgi:hypothetical protein